VDKLALEQVFSEFLSFSLLVFILLLLCIHCHCSKKYAIVLAKQHIIISRICGSHGGEYKDGCLLDCQTTQCYNTDNSHLSTLSCQSYVWSLISEPTLGWSHTKNSCKVAVFKV
jgi:hypothetical protein